MGFLTNLDKVHCDCCGGSCVGCCWPADATALLQLEWEITAPNCSQLDGQTGTFTAQNPQKSSHSAATCGYCTCYEDLVSISLTGEFWTDFGFCMNSPCSFGLCFALECADGEEAVAGLDDCCARIRLILGFTASGGSEGTNQTGITEVSSSDCANQPDCQSNSWYVIDPTSCACDADAEVGLSAVFPLSALVFECTDHTGTSSCDDLQCCLPTDCDFTDATFCIATSKTGTGTP